MFTLRCANRLSVLRNAEEDQKKSPRAFVRVRWMYPGLCHESKGERGRWYEGGGGGESESGVCCVIQSSSRHSRLIGLDDGLGLPGGHAMLAAAQGR